jgi:hypothetical protein
LPSCEQGWSWYPSSQTSLKSSAATLSGVQPRPATPPPTGQGDPSSSSPVVLVSSPINARLSAAVPTGPYLATARPPSASGRRSPGYPTPPGTGGLYRGQLPRVRPRLLLRVAQHWGVVNWARRARPTIMVNLALALRAKAGRIKSNSSGGYHASGFHTVHHSRLSFCTCIC